MVWLQNSNPTPLGCLRPRAILKLLRFNSFSKLLAAGPLSYPHPTIPHNPKSSGFLASAGGDGPAAPQHARSTPLLGIPLFLEGGFWAPCARGGEDQLSCRTPASHLATSPRVDPFIPPVSLHSPTSWLSFLPVYLSFCLCAPLSFCPSPSVMTSCVLARVLPLSFYILFLCFLHAWICFRLPCLWFSYTLQKSPWSSAVLERSLARTYILQALPTAHDQFSSLSRSPIQSRREAGPAQPEQAESWAEQSCSQESEEL